MTGLELFLTIAVVAALAGLALVTVLLRRCVRELRRNRDQLGLLEQEVDSQLEALDRIDRVVHSRAGAGFSEDDLEEGFPSDVQDDRPGPGGSA
jgi:type II secretory pathway pseudopilin PulG